MNTKTKHESESSLFAKAVLRSRAGANTKTEYRTVSTHTLEGLKEAERLHAAGWKTIRAGLFTTQFYRKVTK